MLISGYNGWSILFMNKSWDTKENRKTEGQQDPLKDAAYYRAQAQLHSRQLRETWRIFLRSGVFLFAALVTVVLASFAWFAMNTGVAGTTSSVSVRKHVTRLASKGERLTEEVKGLNLSVGEPFHYEDETYYYTEEGEIALRFGEEQSIFPGARGQVDFYLIPGENSVREVKLCIGLKGYRYAEEETDTAVPADDEVLELLLGGHLLLFERYENGFYSGLLLDTQGEEFPHNSLTVTLPEEAEADVPYPVRIYWVWPGRYENLISHRTGKGDLFAPNDEEFEHIVLPFLQLQNEQGSKVPGQSGYSYNALFLAGVWPPETTESREKAYNLADEYIGTNTDCLYLTISTQHRQ